MFRHSRTAAKNIDFNTSTAVLCVFSVVSGLLATILCKTLGIIVLF
jgi:hypothetical protein